MARHILGLEFARRARRLSQEAVGRMVGLSQAYISDFETGRRNPTLKELQALTDALGVNAPSLLLREYSDHILSPEPKTESEVGR